MRYNLCHRVRDVLYTAYSVGSEFYYLSIFIRVNSPRNSETLSFFFFKLIAHRHYKDRAIFMFLFPNRFESIRKKKKSIFYIEFDTTVLKTDLNKFRIKYYSAYRN